MWSENQLMSLFQFYLYIAGSLHVSGPQAHPQESSHSCSHNHWFSVCTALAVCSVWAYRPILRRVHTAVHTTIGSVSVLLWPCALYEHTGPSSGEFTQLFTQPLVQCLYCSGRVFCMSIQSTRPEQYRHWTNGCVNSCVNSTEDGPVGQKHVEIRQYINKIETVTSVGFYST